MKGNQRIALTKRLLREALLHLMEHEPLDKINITELCSAAGINRATFYRHYSVPRDVLAEMQVEFAGQIQARLDSASLLHSPYQYMERLFSYLHAHSELVKLFIRNDSEEDIISLFDAFFLTLLQENRSILTGRALDDDEIKLVSACMAGSGYFMLRRWLLDDIDKSPTEMAELILSFARQGREQM